jgi:hypothetical protein
MRKFADRAVTAALCFALILAVAKLVAVPGHYGVYGLLLP